MFHNKFINTIVAIYQKEFLCPYEIIYNSNTKCIVKGFRYINNIAYYVPLVEFNDTTRMWVLYKELKIQDS
uniref:PetP protein n=1 Tax=Galaxaura rugosa TaxID=268570 RepID=A0A1G4NT23_9FLOR|nr:hypothetical protein P8459_pgp082 [Galaxaura rugosa]SCW21787.1 petP [Galaxaura rugosa]